MADLINLRQARKARDRKAAEKQAEENRAKFGRTKDEKRRTRANTEIEKDRLEAHRRDGGDSGGVVTEGDEPDDSGAS